MAIKYIENAEKRAEAAREKYGKQTLGEILSRIIIYTLIGYMVIVFVVILMYFSPIDDRLLTSILLIFVLVEMLTEYALWMFTYQGMRKTEAPLQDLQQFSTITKEGWRRAEMFLDWTAPFFAWFDSMFKRSGLDWREKSSTPPVIPTNVPQVAPPPYVEDAMKSMLKTLRDMDARMKSMESHLRDDNEEYNNGTGGT